MGLETYRWTGLRVIALALPSVVSVGCGDDDPDAALPTLFMDGSVQVLQPNCPVPGPCQIATAQGCVPMVAGSACDDGNAENGADVCDATGACVSSATACTDAACSDSGVAVGDAGTTQSGDASAEDASGDAALETDASQGGSDAGDAGGAIDADCPFTPMTVSAPQSDPPYGGMAFIGTELLQRSDPTAFVDLSYAGQAARTVFDRRTAAFGSAQMHLFDTRFGAQTQRTIEFQVNVEFGPSEAEQLARHYAHTVGQMPAFLLRDLDTVTIHAGDEAFGGGNRNLLIHVGQGDAYEQGGSLEEIVIHELGHTSLDGDHANAPDWLAAQDADGVAVSTYGRDNPSREDVAETIGAYLVARFGGARVPASDVATIEAAVPNRLTYFACQGYDMTRLP